MDTNEYMKEMELLSQYEALGTVEELRKSKDSFKLIPCTEKKPDIVLDSTTSYCKTYKSSPVLVQTKKGSFHVAEYVKKTTRTGMYEDWFSYGTGGRRMKVVSKVIGWCYLPESIV